MMAAGLVYFIASFLLGSLPFGIWIARFFGAKDPRTEGSGNIGATNVTRIAGLWPAGVLTLVFDLLKGALPPLLLNTAAPQRLLDLIAGGAVEISPGWVWFSGLCAVLGHCYSPWLRFNGGKGVATGFGVFFVLSPVSAAVGAAVYALSFFFSRVGSLSSIFGVGATAIVFWTLYPVGAFAWAGAAVIWVILLRHHSNIDALLEQREKTF